MATWWSFVKITFYFAMQTFEFKKRKYENKSSKNYSY